MFLKLLYPIIPFTAEDIYESVFGGKAGSHLTKSTVVLTAVFFVLALALAAVIGHTAGGEGDSVQQLLNEKSAVSAPALPQENK